MGVTLASWLAVRMDLAAPFPEHVSWKQIHGAGWLAGIGFTMSLFMASLAFTRRRTTRNGKKLSVLIDGVAVRRHRRFVAISAYTSTLVRYYIPTANGELFRSAL